MIKNNQSKRPVKIGRSKLNKTESTQMRFDPKLRFAVDIVALAQRRSLSGLIETALEKYLQDTPIKHLVSDFYLFSAEERENLTMPVFVNRLWDVSEAVRFIRLAISAPLLLNADQMMAWRNIQNEPMFWFSSDTNSEQSLNIKLLELVWDSVKLTDDDEPIDRHYVRFKLSTLYKNNPTELVEELHSVLNKLVPSSDLQ